MKSVAGLRLQKHTDYRIYVRAPQEFRFTAFMGINRGVGSNVRPVASGGNLIYSPMFDEVKGKEALQKLEDEFLKQGYKFELRPFATYYEVIHEGSGLSLGITIEESEKDSGMAGAITKILSRVDWTGLNRNSVSSPDHLEARNEAVRLANSSSRDLNQVKKAR